MAALQQMMDVWDRARAAVICQCQALFSLKEESRAYLAPRDSSFLTLPLPNGSWSALGTFRQPYQTHQRTCSPTADMLTITRSPLRSLILQAVGHHAVSGSRFPSTTLKPRSNDARTLSVTSRGFVAQKYPRGFGRWVQPMKHRTNNEGPESHNP